MSNIMKERERFVFMSQQIAVILQYCYICLISDYYGQPLESSSSKPATQQRDSNKLIQIYISDSLLQHFSCSTDSKFCFYKFWHVSRL